MQVPRIRHYGEKKQTKSKTIYTKILNWQGKNTDASTIFSPNTIFLILCHLFLFYQLICLFGFCFLLVISLANKTCSQKSKLTGPAHNQKSARLGFTQLQRHSGALPRNYSCALKEKVIGEGARGEQEHRTTSCSCVSAQFRSTRPGRR